MCRVRETLANMHTFLPLPPRPYLVYVASCLRAGRYSSVRIPCDTDRREFQFDVDARSTSIARARARANDEMKFDAVRRPYRSRVLSEPVSAAPRETFNYSEAEI